MWLRRPPPRGNSGGARRQSDQGRAWDHAWLQVLHCSRTNRASRKRSTQWPAVWINPAVGPRHSYLKEMGRVQYGVIDDKEAIDAFFTLAQWRDHPGHRICPRRRLCHQAGSARRRAAFSSTSPAEATKDIDFVIKNYGAQYGIRFTDLSPPAFRILATEGLRLPLLFHHAAFLIFSIADISLNSLAARSAINRAAAPAVQRRQGISAETAAP